MPLHKNLSGAELHYPLGRSSEGTLLLEDDLASAYQIAQGSDNQFNVSTVNGTEEITIGNGVQNPKLTLSGSGLFTSGGGHKYKTATLTGAGGTHDLAEESHVVLVDTSSAAEQINLPTPANVTNQVFLIIDKLSTFGTNNLVLHRKASEKIDNATSDKTLSDSGARLWLFCDGTNWFTFLDGESQSGGGAAAGYTVSAKDANFSAAVDYYYVIDTVTNTAAITVTLPNAATVASGKTMGFKARHGASYSVTLNRGAGGNIDGAASNLILSTDMAAVELICDGTDWWIKS